MINLLLFIPCSIDLQKERRTQEEHKKNTKRRKIKKDKVTQCPFFTSLKIQKIHCSN